MKAAIYTDYGPPDVIQITDVEKPVPKDDEVLIKVRAASVNPLDWRLMRGEPAILRLFLGLRKPKIGRPGADENPIDKLRESFTPLSHWERVGVRAYGVTHP